jgi:hypothetical protein
MIFDPAWDMPRVNWQQQGSFEIPEIPPAFEPDEAPLVCLPPINEHWLPFVMGALDQLRSPSSWLVADDDAMSTTLYRVTKLRQMIGGRADCMSLMIRFDGASCQLQQSVDGGTTWTEVDGWGDFVTCLPPQTLVEFDSGCTLSQSLDGGMTYEAVPGWLENFGDCVQKFTPIIGPPPNPGDEAPDQFACSIASYLASTVILNAMSAAVVAIQDDLTLLAFGANVLDFIPEFVLVRLGYDAISIIYAAVAEGTLSDYEDAIANADLWHDIACAIYGAIASDGYVTPGNFADIVSAVGGVPYAHSDVISKIVDYLNSLGATGLAQLSQRAGLETGADCSACAAWCRVYDFTTSAWAFSWSGVNGGFYSGASGWVSTPCSPTIQCLDFENGSTGSFTIDTVRLEGGVFGGSATVFEMGDAALANTISMGLPGSGLFDITADGPITVDSLRIVLITNGTTPQNCNITKMTLTGRGAPPVFGAIC